MDSNQQLLKNIAAQLMANDKGLLAMDESTATCNKRFADLGIPQNEEYRRKYRELIVTTPGLEESISGAILFDETIRQRAKDGTLLIDILKNKGIIPGIKVDEGTIPMAGFPGEKITEGIDKLPERLKEYHEMGAQFAKWRAVITIGQDLPTATSIKANAYLLARYAALCQEAGLLPIVEPEVIMDGDHSLKVCAQVTTEVLHAVFNALYQHRVDLECMILKPNMVLPGKDASAQNSAEEIANATISCFLRCVPAAVPVIAFLSGGQAAELATQRLNAMHQMFDKVMPWKLTFSFSRAVQQPALEIWKGNDQNIVTAQKALAHRAACNRQANRGEYTADSEIQS
ncbi:class I fructose-bisphosphate aldolase [Mucilaginibacter paludis]|uniref:Probable fructose-bisphosphate aldolase class 1 n=1 Tax=Mucilaginibacter paludis DSM 18603 TaxID=714943 RepID=H1YBC4_9SPHI|nr:class I fructose-bisphosphate aldolase [Mucilaginibacter paludis]EHQ31178.1 fructose-bisphosphate aldolase class-I [Mucilaginibacter paludis DSM 18603]